MSLRPRADDVRRVAFLTSSHFALAVSPVLTYDKAVMQSNADIDMLPFIPGGLSWLYTGVSCGEME